MSAISVRRAGLYGLVAVLMFGPLLVAAIMSWRLASDAVYGRLGEAAGGAVAEADAVIDHVVDELRFIVAFPSDMCGPDVVNYLQTLVYRSPHMREIGLFDDAMHFHCTNIGPVDFSYTPEEEAELPQEGVVITLRKSALFDLPSVFVNIRGPGGAGADALLHPETFRRPLAFGDTDDAGIYMEVPGEGLLASSSGRPGPPARDVLVVEERSSRYAIVAQAWADPRVVVEAFWEQFRMFGPLALVSGALAAFFASRQLRRAVTMGAELREAIRKGDLEVHYQPIVDIQQRTCVGAEALIRWRHPRRGLIRPDLFIGLAEDTGLIVPMTRWLVKQVALELEPVFRAHAEFRVGINLSAVHFRNFDIIDEMQRIFARYGIGLDRVVVEVTERQVIAQNDRAPDVMNRMREQGVRISLDDFGTGHNGLSYLRSLPLDSLKIDKGFVATIGGDAPARPVLDGILDLAARMNMKLVAEGVESPAQEKWLRDRGVRLAQGYLFARPMPVGQLVEFLDDISAKAFGNLIEDAPARPKPERVWGI